MQIPYTIRKPSGLFYFRFVHPDGELRLSLDTNDKHQARAKAAHLRLVVDSLLPSSPSRIELKQSLKVALNGSDSPAQALPAPQSIQTPVQQPETPPAAKLADLWNEYLQHGLADTRESTKKRFRAALDVFIELCGSLRVSQVDKVVARHFIGKLATYPKHRTQGRFGKMSLDAIRSESNYQPITTTTQGNLISHVSSFFNWLAKFGYIDQNPLTGLSPKRSKPAKRKTWTESELKQWFRMHRTESGWKYWLPVLAIYTGARLEELAALAPGDIHQHQGQFYIRLHDDDNRQLKNENSKRLIPIHSQLITLGFLNLVNDRRNHARLFDLQAYNGKYSHNAGKWLGRQRAKLGIEPDFHGLRHTVIESLRLAGADITAIQWLVGHAGQSMTDHYGMDADKLQRLPVMAQAVELLDWMEMVKK